MNAMHLIVGSGFRWRHAVALLAWVVAATTAGCAAPAPVSQPVDRIVQAREILREARASAAGVEEAYLKDLAFMVIAEWQVVAGEVPNALETAAAIADAGSRGEALTAIGWVVCPPKVRVKAPIVAS